MASTKDIEEIPMHELSITMSIVDICEQNAGGNRVVAVTLELGELAGVVAEAIMFCFESCTKGTVLEGARLVIDRIAACGCCHDCGAQFAMSTYYESCPSCGGFAVEILHGRELRVKELEVE